MIPKCAWSRCFAYMGFAVGDVVSGCSENRTLCSVGTRWPFSWTDVFGMAVRGQSMRLFRRTERFGGLKNYREIKSEIVLSHEH